MDQAGLLQLVTENVLASGFRRATFGGVKPWSNASAGTRIVVRPLQLRGENQFQVTSHDGRRTIVKNYPSAAMHEHVRYLVSLGPPNIHLTLARSEISIRISKRGKILVGRKQTAAVPETIDTHNRVKDVPLPEGQANRLLHTLGIATAEGRVKPTMRAKYTQINEFLKHFQHEFEHAGLRNQDRPLRIVDCGCGLSYLTLALHHYLNTVLHVPAEIVGVDVNDELIRKSIDRAHCFGATETKFSSGSITNVAKDLDIVVALHACDTATDDAIALAIQSQARLFLGVPCCHHALHGSIKPTGDASILRPILRHGILQQRQADLATDALRALLLRICGYRTEVVEFVSPEHTARNVMIRAVAGAPAGDPAIVREYRAFCQFWGVVPYLEHALDDTLYRLLEPSSD